MANEAGYVWRQKYSGNFYLENSFINLLIVNIVQIFYSRPFRWCMAFFCRSRSLSVWLPSKNCSEAGKDLSLKLPEVDWFWRIGIYNPVGTFSRFVPCTGLLLKDGVQTQVVSDRVFPATADRFVVRKFGFNILINLTQGHTFLRNTRNCHAY